MLLSFAAALLACAAPVAATSPAFDQLNELAGGAARAPVPVVVPAGTSAWTGFPGRVALLNRMLLVPAAEDLDQDGLADAAEAELASLARPYFVFSSQENALRPGEPKTLFQVRPAGCSGPRSRCEGKDLIVNVTYLNLWQRDGGYGKISWCGDRHIGDDQALNVRLASSDDGNTFRIVAVENWDYVWPTKSGAVRFHQGTHPEIVFSAGKHHQFFDTSMHGRASSYTKWGCKETLDENGPKFMSVLKGNVGEPEHRAGFVDDLTAIGFPGESAWSRKPFCGGLPCAADNPTSSTAGIWSSASFFVPPGPKPPF